MAEQRLMMVRSKEAREYYEAWTEFWKAAGFTDDEAQDLAYLMMAETGRLDRVEGAAGRSSGQSAGGRG